MARTTAPRQSENGPQPGLQPDSRLDVEHIAAVCDEVLHDIDPTHVEPNHTAAHVAVPTSAHLTALHDLRRVGYQAETMTSPQPPLMSWIRISGWDHDALACRLDGLTVTSHQLTRDLPDNIAHAIDTYATIADLPDLDAPQYRAAAGLRAKLRDQATAATGPRAPYNPDRLPTDPELAQLLKRVRAREHRVEDLISRTWLTSVEAITRYDQLRHENPHSLARAEALTHTLNHGIEQAKRDTIITVIEWAREAGHGDAIAYAHWYAHAYGTTDNGPEPAVAYGPWHDHATAQHPAAVAAHDHPTDLPGNMLRDIPSAVETIDASNIQDQNQTYERNTPQPGRRA